MFCTNIGLVTLIFIIAASSARGQTADEQWKGLVMQALYAASSNDYAKAEQTFLRAMHEAERFGAEDARVGTTLNSLGLVYRAEKKYADAKSAYRRALAILEKSYGDGSIDVANINFNIATVMFDQNHLQTALPYAQKALISYEALLGGQSLKTAAALCMVGDSFRAVKSYTEAEGPLRRCADIRESDGGLQNPDLAEAQHSLALALHLGSGQAHSGRSALQAGREDSRKHPWHHQPAAGPDDGGSRLAAAPDGPRQRGRKTDDHGDGHPPDPEEIASPLSISD